MDITLPTLTSQLFSDVDKFKNDVRERDVIIQNLRMQLETHRHMLKLLLDFNNEQARKSVREFLELPWGVR